MKIAYLDCFSGISGDMFLGALLDAGVPAALFHETVAALNAAGNLEACLEVQRVDRSGISASKVDVRIRGSVDAPREHSHAHQPAHSHAHDHARSQAHDHAPLAPPAHAHRGLKEIRSILAGSGISSGARETAEAVFNALGAAETKVHNIDVEKVHFHEVGAADAIVDIACAAVGSEALGVEEWVCSPLNVGSGTVECAHGTFPVPAPATAELLNGMPVFSSGIPAELVTPTGAAIVRVLASRFAPLPAMKIASSGYGAGARDFAGHPNVMRLLVGNATASIGTDELAQPLGPAWQQETIAILEASMDDLNPQVFAYVMERLLAEDALDVFATPVQMKKGRPGMLLTVLARPQDATRLARLVFTETSTLGVRVRQEARAVLSRETLEVHTPWGAVRVKVAGSNGSIEHYAPEFEDCRRIAAEHGIALKKVMQEAVSAYRQQASIQDQPAGKAKLRSA